MNLVQWYIFLRQKISPLKDFEGVQRILVYHQPFSLKSTGRPQFQNTSLEGISRPLFFVVDRQMITEMLYIIGWFCIHQVSDLLLNFQDKQESFHSDLPSSSINIPSSCIIFLALLEMCLTPFRKKYCIPVFILENSFLLSNTSEKY